MKPYLNKLIERQDLTSAETELIWDSLLSGSNPAAMAALLVLLRAKSETSAEIAGMVRSMKKVCLPVHSADQLLDIVGTGGDGADTINISTASAILAAACGCKVAKVGNRSVSSQCGSADVLERLGVEIELSPKQVEQCIASAGIGFMFAPVHHPAMKNIRPVRSALGVRTAFNILGPITNPASAQRVVIGVFEDNLVDLVAGALQELQFVDHAVVIHGCGLDEISPLGPSKIYEIRNIAPPGASMKQYVTSK